MFHVVEISILPFIGVPHASRRSFTSSKICSLKSWIWEKKWSILRCSLGPIFFSPTTNLPGPWGYGGFHQWFHHQTVRLPTLWKHPVLWGVGGEALSFWGPGNLREIESWEFGILNLHPHLWKFSGSLAFYDSEKLPGPPQKNERNVGSPKKVASFLKGNESSEANINFQGGIYNTGTLMVANIQNLKVDRNSFPVIWSPAIPTSPMKKMGWPFFPLTNMTDPSPSPPKKWSKSQS